MIIKEAAIVHRLLALRALLRIAALREVTLLITGTHWIPRTATAARTIIRVTASTCRKSTVHTTASTHALLLFHRHALAADILLRSEVSISLVILIKAWVEGLSGCWIVPCVLGWSAISCAHTVPWTLSLAESLIRILIVSRKDILLRESLELGVCKTAGVSSEWRSSSALRELIHVNLLRPALLTLVARVEARTRSKAVGFCGFQIVFILVEEGEPFGLVLSYMYSVYVFLNRFDKSRLVVFIGHAKNFNQHEVSVFVLHELHDPLAFDYL